MRAVLDRLYASALHLAAASLVLIAALVGAQVLGRVFDLVLKLLGYSPYGFLVASLAEIAGYLLAAGSFLALAATLKRGAHIRVTILLVAVPERVRRWLELWTLAAATAFVTYVSFHLGQLVYDSYRFKEVSYGLIPVPLAIPQVLMAVGASILLVALLDELVLTWRNGRPSFRLDEDAVLGNREG
jgi:TRAP-type C4-dicarboxylate transport system permease small subunit